MDTHRTESPFAQSGLRYSALRYLQQRLARQCTALPDRFDSLETWEQFREGLVFSLREKLPVWVLGDGDALCRHAEAALGSRLVLESVDVPFEQGFFVPVHVYRAKRRDQPSPAVVVCHGYGEAKNTPHIVDACMALAESGMVAVAVEYDASGERADRPDVHTDINNVSAVGHLLGINNVGLRVMTNLAVLRHLKTRPDVDPARIGITGLCQGALITWFTAAVCGEFSAVAPLCGATTYEAIALEYCNRQGGWTGISPYVFGLLEVADMAHVAAVSAPRPLLVQNNIIDVHWPLSGFEKVKRFTEHIYGLYGASEQCAFRLEHGPHAYAEPFLSKLVAWFKRVLA